MNVNYEILKNKISIKTNFNETKKFTIYSRKVHLLIEIFRRIFCCIKKSEKVRLNDQKIIYTSHSNAEKIRTILKSLPKYDFHPEFANEAAKNLAEAIKKGEHQQLNNLMTKTSKSELLKALEAQDNKKGVNLLSYAAYINNSMAVQFLSSACESAQLKKLLTQKDKSNWTALHHLALMNDDGASYRMMKKKAAIDTKTVSEFYCESPSMFRKFIKENPGKFSTQAKKTDKGAKLYFRDGMPGKKTEQHLTLDEVQQQYGKLFSHKPHQFKFIPHFNAKYLKDRWLEKEKTSVNKKSLAALDIHLKSIYVKGEEDGIAVTTVKYDDRGMKIPEKINLGVGAEARKEFHKGDLITLYGGEYFAEGEMPAGRSRDYSYGGGSDTIDGLRFRSYGSTFIHSAPNTKFWEIESSLGFKFLAFKALDEIAAGESLCLSYGSGYFSSRQIVPLEIRPAAMMRMKNNNKRDATQTSYLEIKSQVL